MTSWRLEVSIATLPHCLPMSLWDPPKIVRLYEGPTRDAAIRLAGRDAYGMAQQGFEVTEARWAPPQEAPETGGNAIRRAGAAIARVLGRRTAVERRTGILIVTWTQTAEGPIQGTPGGPAKGPPGGPPEGTTERTSKGPARGPTGGQAQGATRGPSDGMAEGPAEGATRAARRGTTKG